MKVFTFLVAMVFFLGGFALFVIAFNVAWPFNIVLFLGGILAAAVALALPFHVLELFD